MTSEQGNHRWEMGDAILTAFFLTVLGGAAAWAMQWPFRASLIVYSLASVGVPLALVQLGLILRGLWLSGKGFQTLTTTDPETREVYRRTGAIFLWILAIAGGIILVGYRITLPLFGLLYSRTYGAGWKTALIIAFLAEGFLVLIFDQLLHVVWPTPLLLSLGSFLF